MEDGLSDLRAEMSDDGKGTDIRRVLASFYDGDEEEGYEPVLEDERIDVDVAAGALMYGIGWVSEMIKSELGGEEGQFTDDLPEVFSAAYTPEFLSKMLECASDLRDQFVNGWSGLRCVAQEILFYLAVEEAVSWGSADLFGMGSGLKELTECLFEDTDFLMLYDKPEAALNPRVAAVLGFVNLAVEDWFTPFRGEASRDVLLVG